MCEILQSFPKAFIGKLSSGAAVEAYLLSGKQQVEQLHALVLIMLYSSSSGGSQKALMGNSQVLGRLLSSTLLRKQVSSILELRKACHSACLCAGWLGAGVNA